MHFSHTWGDEGRDLLVPQGDFSRVWHLASVLAAPRVAVVHQSQYLSCGAPPRQITYLGYAGEPLRAGKPTLSDQLGGGHVERRHRGLQLVDSFRQVQHIMGHRLSWNLFTHRPVPSGVTHEGDLPTLIAAAQLVG